MDKDQTTKQMVEGLFTGFNARSESKSASGADPLFGYGERHRRGKPEPAEVVAICDHLVALGEAELKNKIGGKASGVALDLLVQALGGYAVKRGKVGVDHNLVAADDKNLPGDARRDNKSRSYSICGDDGLLLPVLSE